MKAAALAVAVALALSSAARAEPLEPPLPVRVPGEPGVWTLYPNAAPFPVLVSPTGAVWNVTTAAPGQPTGFNPAANLYVQPPGGVFTVVVTTDPAPQPNLWHPGEPAPAGNPGPASDPRPAEPPQPGNGGADNPGLAGGRT